METFYYVMIFLIGGCTGIAALLIGSDISKHRHLKKINARAEKARVANLEGEVRYLYRMMHEPDGAFNRLRDELKTQKVMMLALDTHLPEIRAALFKLQDQVNKPARVRKK